MVVLIVLVVLVVLVNKCSYQTLLHLHIGTFAHLFQQLHDIRNLPGVVDIVLYDAIEQ